MAEGCLATRYLSLADPQYRPRQTSIRDGPIGNTGG